MTDSNDVKTESLMLSAHILGKQEMETASAWYENVTDYSHPGFKWIVGKYLQIGVPNENKQLFSTEEAERSAKTLMHAPINVNHRSLPMGTFVGSSIVHPLDENTPPYLEVLGAVWPKTNPELFHLVERANEEGSLYFSVEALPETAKFTYPDGSSEMIERHPSMPYAQSHPEQFELASSTEFFNSVYYGGAMIIPPITPGLSTAFASFLTDDNSDEFAEVANKIGDNSDTKENTDIAERNTDEDEPSVSDEGSETGDKVDTIEVKDVPEDVRQSIIEAHMKDSAVTENADALATENAKLQSDLDAAVAGKAAAEQKLLDTDAFLAAKQTELEEAAAFETRKTERLAAIKGAVRLPEDHVTENAERWAMQSDDEFEATLSNMKIAQGFGNAPSTDDAATENASLVNTMNSVTPTVGDETFSTLRKVMG